MDCFIRAIILWIFTLQTIQAKPLWTKYSGYYPLNIEFKNKNCGSTNIQAKSSEPFYSGYLWIWISRQNPLDVRLCLFTTRYSGYLLWIFRTLLLVRYFTRYPNSGLWIYCRVSTINHFLKVKLVYKHTVKKFNDFPVGNNLIYSRPGRVWSVTSRLGTGNHKPFLQCSPPVRFRPSPATGNYSVCPCLFGTKSIYRKHKNRDRNKGNSCVFQICPSLGACQLCLFLNCAIANCACGWSELSSYILTQNKLPLIGCKDDCNNVKTLCLRSASFLLLCVRYGLN